MGAQELPIIRAEKTCTSNSCLKMTILVGAQLAGGEGIKERIDALSLAIRKKTTIRDLLDLETCYAPPVSMLVDPLRPAVKAAIRNMKEKEDNKTK